MYFLVVTTFALIFLRAWQQQNVIHGFYVWAVITSYGIALADVLTVVGITKYGVASVIYVGTGGALGVVCAMALHKILRMG